MAIEPINYSAAMPKQDDFLQSIMGGLQVGSALRNVQLQQQQQQAQQARAQQYQSDLASFMQAPSLQAINALRLKYPEHREAYKDIYSSMDEEQQKSVVRDVGTTLAALQSGQNDVAERLLKTRVDTLKKSGQPAEFEQRMLEGVQQRQPWVSGGLWAFAGGIPGGDKLLENLGKLGTEQRAQALAPSTLTKAEADAKSAVSDAELKGITARYGEQSVLLDLRKKGVEIQHLVDDTSIKRESNRIAAMNAAANKESNSLKREELTLKIAEARRSLDEKLREKVAEYEGGQATLQDAMNLLTELRSDEDSLRAATGSLGMRGAIPGTKARTAAGKIEQLQNTLAASNLDKLKGAMSDKDILFLKNITSNLDRFQDEDKFMDELGKVERIIVRADKQMRAKFGDPKKPAPSADPSSTGQAQRNVVVDW